MSSLSRSTDRTREPSAPPQDDLRAAIQEAPRAPWFVVATALLLAASCVGPTPNYCDDQHPCARGRVCNFDKKQCEAAPDVGADSRAEPDGAAADQNGTDSGGTDSVDPNQVSTAIAGVRAGATNVPITGAVVTYLIPSTLYEPNGGFVIQAQREGPALFVGLDPAGLTPAISVGDTIACTVTSSTSDGQVSPAPIATAITEVSVSTPPGDALSALVKDVSDRADLVGSFRDFELELIDSAFEVTGPVVDHWRSGAEAPIDTNAVKGNAKLGLRLTAIAQRELGLGQGCKGTLASTLLWSSSSAQVNLLVGRAKDVASYTCPPVRLLSAVSTGERQVELTFDRPIVSVQANGADFSIDKGLAITDASLDPKGQIVYLGTAAQAAGTTYSVSVGGSVKDALGQSIDPTATSATFSSP